MSDEKYWKALVSTVYRALSEKGSQAATVIKNATFEIRFNKHDNWNGGIDYWDIVFMLKYRDYTTLGDKKAEFEDELEQFLSDFHRDERNLIANVIIEPIIEQFIDWRAIYPETKAGTIELIEEEKELLTAIATGRSYKDDGVEDDYITRHRKIIEIAGKAGFEYPVQCNSLAEWWIQIKNVGNWADRRAGISQMFAPILDLLRASEEDTFVDFTQITNRSKAVRKAVEDAVVFIREGLFDSAVERVHAAFHGYLRTLLDEHGVGYQPTDNLTSLYNKLHTCYETIIQPADVAARVKVILRSAGGMVQSVNELRNNNTIAHPNSQLIEKREAELVIRILNAVIDYIEAIEASLS